MAQTLHKDKFECDRQAKYDFTASTVSYIAEKYSGQTVSVEFYEFNSKNQFIEFDSKSAYDKSRLDIGMKFTKSGIPHYYVFELKERWGEYVSYKYGEEDKEGWMYNQPKDSVLKKAKGYGMIPCYVNLYPDEVVRCWNIGKIKEFGHITKTYNKYNVVESEVMKQDRLTLMNDQGVAFKRIRGEKSDGRWTATA